jgi:hypothetical protein
MQEFARISQAIIRAAFSVVVKKSVPIAERFFCYNTYAAILFSEHYYDNWYKSKKLPNPSDN